jgi:hypothetical protein
VEHRRSLVVVLEDQIRIILKMYPRLAANPADR